MPMFLIVTLEEGPNAFKNVGEWIAEFENGYLPYKERFFSQGGEVRLSDCGQAVKEVSWLCGDSQSRGNPDIG